MTITSTPGAEFNVAAGGDYLEVFSGTVTVTGDAGGFNETLEAVPDGAGGFYYSVNVGDDRGGYATLILTGGGDGVNIAIEDAATTGFPATIRVADRENSIGSLYVEGGATLSSINSGLADGSFEGTYQNLLIGFGAGSSGVVDVRDAGSNITVGGVGATVDVARFGGYGILEVGEGGSVSANRIVVGRDDGSDGRVVVSGGAITLDNAYGTNADTNYLTNGPFFAVGRDGGVGRLDLSDGGLVEISNTDGVTDGGSLQVGRDGGVGALTVDGVGTQLNLSQIGPIDQTDFGVSILAGRGGSAYLEVTNGGAISITGEDAFMRLGET
ncbi:MAG: hypothetical protein AAFU55_14830, partial [Pseudomonadota bacterium]